MNGMTQEHENFLREAVETARIGLESGNPPFTKAQLELMKQLNYARV